MNSPSKRHHTVPQFYLKGFSKNAQLRTVELPGNRQFLQSVKRASSENEFYSIADHPEGKDVFERALATLEGEAARVIGRISSGAWPLGVEDRTVLAEFIAVQALRGPDQRRNMEYIAAQMTRLEVGFGGRDGVADWAARQGIPNITKEEADRIWSEATAPTGPPIRLAPIAHARQILDSVEEIVKYLIARPWSLSRFSRKALITSDSPVGLVPHPDDEPWKGVGFATAWGITFPVSRRIGLIMTDLMIPAEANYPVEQIWEGSLDNSAPGTAQLARFLNNATVSSSCRWLYLHPDDASALPQPLPMPTTHTIQVAGGSRSFSGEPFFSKSD